jgi:nucleoside-diphosphate-sugar epimerase
VRPTSPYAAAKVAIEAYCHAYYRSFGVDARIVRLFSVYGPGMHRFAIHDLIRKVAQSDTELSLLGDGEQVRDYLYIDDAVEAIILVARKGDPGEDYNVASGEPTRLRDLAESIAKLLDKPQLRIAPTGVSFPGDTPRWFANIEKIRSIGFRQTVPLDEGLRRTWRWMQNEGIA